MKNIYLTLVLFSTFLIQSTNLFSQSNSKFSFSVKSGVTYGDTNYGNEFAFEYLQNEDYTGIGASNDAGVGLDLGIGLLYQLNQKTEINISTGYLLLGTKIFGNIQGLRSTVTRPLSPLIPISVDGSINYSLLSFGGDFIYNFKGNNASGVTFSVGMNYWIHLNTDWNVEVIYETGNTGTQKNLSDVANTDLNNVLATNFRLGYNIIISDKYRITPLFGFDLGLNEFRTNDSLSPSFFSFNIRFNFLK